MELDVDGRLPGLRSAFRRSVDAASVVMKRRMKVLVLVQRAYRRMARHESALDQVTADLTSLLRLTRAWATGRYRRVPWKSVLFALAGIMYFLNPIDLIPDALIGIGFIDDAAVIAAVVRAIHNDLRQYERWEEDQNREIDGGT